ncbi:MAG: exodeoxyribonuclease III [Planctomycetota bacterium]
MNIVSYNINGVRSAIKKGLLDWIADNEFDVVCLQETKAHSGSVPTLLIDALGYQHYWHSAKRKGYSGVATFCRAAPTKVYYGLGIEKYDSEGRVIRTDFEDLTILNCYFPNGGSGEERQRYKMEFLDDFHHWVERLLEERPNVIVVGDYNIAHQPIDINDPVRNKNRSGYLPEERAWMDQWFETGFVDAFRDQHPNEVSYTWWRTTQFARKTNKGWRLDYQSVSDNLVHRIADARHLQDIEHSDHCPVLLKLKS